ncbi:Zinc finger protein on ecdysone puffs [Papilio xuthus]|uniref:Zinc finger protein on ecdysone puffs n=1 Tax=Papilio xuthus TaxID=66420 RepID=A0A194PRC9_PAPXU|nr:Zinc finger protein on ecdysone puffs [Papilio xuthus]
MANRRPQNNGRRMDFGRNDRPKNFGRSGVSPWQGAGPGGGIPNLLPLAGGSTEATLALASNIINLLQPRQNPVPSLLDMPIRRDFGPNMGRYDRGFGPNRMGNQGNFRRTGNYNRAGERINTNRKPFRPNDGQRHQNKSSPKKDADSKAKPVKESDQDQGEKEETGEKSETSEQRKEALKTRYDDINSQLLKCHICNKSMWDGRSFENHLSGRAHAIMMQKTAESYALTADTMRQEIKIREMKRTRKIGQQPPRDFYCAMCDMYAADGAIHRTTVGHRKLKKYLHPTCTYCHKEMPTRIELDEHRLTAEHLRNMQDKQEVVTKPKPEVMVISTMSMEQSYLREDRERWRRPERVERIEKQDTHKENETVKEEKIDDQGDVEMKSVGDEDAEKGTDKPVQSETTTEEVQVKKEDNGLDGETTILDYKEGDDLSNVTQDMIPVYSTERGVGRSFLSEFRCVQCSLCRKLLDSEETAEVHLKTWRHHQLFIRLITRSNSQLQEGSKRQMNVEICGNWKRRKTSRDEDTEDDHDNYHEEGEGAQADVNGEKAANEGDVSVEKAVEVKIEEDVAINTADEDLEDWEQSVDEILHHEKNNTTETTSDAKTEAEEDKLLEEDASEKKNSQENVTSKLSPRRSKRRQ